MRIDLGEPTEEMAGLSDEELDVALRGVDTTALDEAAVNAYGAYLNEWASAIRQRFSSSVPSAKSFGHDADTDPVATAELIADILGGLFGDDALAAFDESTSEEKSASGYVRKRGPWNELAHPRGPNGRFIPKGSAEAVAAAKQNIDGIRKLGAKARTPEHAKQLAQHLAILTVKQLNEMKKQYGLKASGATREQLVQKILDRLPGAQERIDRELKGAAKKLGLPEHATMQDVAERLALDAGYPEHFLTRQELTEKLDEVGVSVPVQRGEAVQAAFRALRDGIAPQEKPQPELESRFVSAADLRARNPDMDLDAIGKLNREIHNLEMERQAGHAPGIPERAGLQDRIDALKNERDKLAGVRPGESVSEWDMQELTRPQKNPKKPRAEENRGEARQETGATGTEREGSPTNDGSPASAGDQVAATPGEPSHASGDRGGTDRAESAGEGTTRRVPAQVEQVNRRLDRYEKHFRDKGNHRAADWMGMLRNHVNSVGVDTALESLGAEVQGQGEEVQYGGHELTDNAGNRKHDANFIESYLDRAGISLVQGSTPIGERRTISAVSASSDTEGLHSRDDERDFFPKLQTLKHKLDEAQHLPGLEKSEDLGKLMGGELGSEITHMTPEVVQKLDDTYGKDQWIVKSYDDAAYAGFGIFFPQRARQVTQDARNTIWASGEQLARYGFSHLRDDKGRVVGIEHQGGDEYRFGTDKYDKTINGEVRQWADCAADAAASEQHTALPRRWQDTPTRYMAQPAFPAVGISNEERAQGVTFKRGGEGRTHIVTRNGKAELVPHSTWLKLEPLPVVFEDADTRAMAQAALDAINALPESERQGQIYAPDIMRTGAGYKVVEANPSNEAGGSGYLGDNPLVMDSYVSHLTGREPAHVRFIRRLLSSREK